MQFDRLKRREFISVLGSAAVAWPLAARAQQPAMPIIGFLSSLSQNDLGLVIPGFLQGLNSAGFIEGRSIAIEYRWAEGDYQRLPDRRCTVNSSGRESCKIVGWTLREMCQ